MGEGATGERHRIKLYQAVAIVVSALGLFTACGLIPERASRSVGPIAPPLPPQIPHLIKVSTEVLRFPDTAVGTQGAPQHLLLTNTSAVTMQLRSIQLVGEQYASFHQGGTCAHELPAGESCEVLVVFQPRVVGNQHAGLIIDWMDGESQAIQLTGSGVTTVR